MPCIGHYLVWHWRSWKTKGPFRIMTEEEGYSSNCKVFVQELSWEVQGIVKAYRYNQLRLSFLLKAKKWIPLVKNSEWSLEYVIHSKWTNIFRYSTHYQKFLLINTWFKQKESGDAQMNTWCSFIILTMSICTKLYVYHEAFMIS